jgi:cysteate synthase
MKTSYSVVCTSCGKSYTDDAMPLSCDCGTPALLRADYEKKQLNPGPESLGLYKFADWMPVRRILDGSASPVTYRSDKLASRAGVKDLIITFNGFWPEKGADMQSGTFKECEAFSVCARIPKDYAKTLVVASAGNTARAFARVCSANNIPLVIVVPEKNLQAMWFTEPVNDCVKLIAAGGGSDYFDAIHLSGIIAGMEGYFPEGGAKNIARRDGMATTVLSAATATGTIPAYYFQAVGSGTGAIAAWEANRRLLEDGRFGSRKMSLRVSQNAPFLLIHDSWKRKSRDLVELDLEIASKQIDIIDAKVLSNRKPPYALTGGLYDALLDSEGDVYAATNAEAKEAAAVFLETEGIDISPAASVALASLLKAVHNGDVDTDLPIMLNITGGGMERIKQEKQIFTLKPTRVIPNGDITEDKVREILAKL